MSAVITLLIIALYLLSQNSSVQRYLTEKIANKLSEQLNTEFHVGGVDITLFNKLVLKEVWMEDNNLDTLFYVNRLVADIDSFSVRKKYIAINNITFNTSRLFLLIDSTGEYNYQFPENINTDNNRRTQKWNISCNNFDFEQSNFSFGKGVFNLKKNEFFTDINLSISDLSINGDSISTNLDNLSFKYTNNLEIKNLSASIEANPEKINIERINLNTIKSSVVNANLEIALEDSSTNFSDLNINLTVGQSYLNMKDISIFIPSLRGMDDVFEFSGRIFGNPMDLKGRNIIFKTGENTLINCNFYANDISDLNDIYLFFDLSLLQTTFSDLSKLQFPLSSQIQNLSFPESFYNAGILTYKGNFTGFLSNFVAYGKLESEMGNISTDLSFLPGEAGNLKLDGKLTTTEFKVGELFNKKDFNKISFDSEINGEYNKDLNYLQGTFNGEISSFDVFGYNYKNININGLFENKNFDGFINIDGPNLKLDFLGKLHFNPQIPEFDFELSVRNADLVALKLDSIHKISDLAFIGKANFKGNSIDNLNGFINIENGSYLNSNGELTIQDMGIKTKASENNKTITFNSDFLDLEIDGQYNLKTLPLTFKYLLSKYLPVLSPDTSLLTDYQNNFKYIAEFKNLDKLTTVFKPDITILTPFSFEGEFDTRNNLLNLFGDIPGISTEKIIIKDISVRAKTNDSFNTNIKFGQVQSISGLNLYNLTLNTEAVNNLLDTKLTWNNYHLLTYSGELNTSSTIYRSGNNIKADIEIIPSKIYIADSLWQIKPGTINIDTSSIHINNLELYDQNQSVKINGILSNKPQDRLTASFQNINLKQIENYLQKEPTLNGIVNGSVDLEDYYGKRMIYSDLNLDSFKFKGHNFGNITLANLWDSKNQVVKTDLNMIMGDDNKLTASGFYDPVSDSLEFETKIDSLPTLILEQVIRKTLSDFKGTASGNLKIYGKPDNLLLDGALMGENASLLIDYTKVAYNFNDSVYFSGNQIIFDHITVTDELNNQGIFNGTITHNNFKDMIYDLSISSPKILALNTTLNDNSQFFGKVIADGNFYITGQSVKIDLQGDGKTLLGTDVNISLDNEHEAEQYDFIRFVSHDFVEKEEEIVFTSKADTSLNLNLRIEVTPDAKAQLIYNSQVGDIIRGQGEGVLQFGMDNNNDITIYGNYNIVEGDYLFTLKNVINKRFSIEPGGSINWSGDPYNARINIEALYKLKASLYELFANSNFDIDKSQRIPIECKILLTDNLTNPDINFDIDFPMVETRLVDELQQFFNTEEEMNKQIISLVVLGQFYTPEYMRGTYEAITSSSHAIGSTVSELFSNQFSNWLSQISSDIDIGFNYRPGTQLTRDEIEFALSKQMFNDRVTINGNIANNVNPTSNNNSQIVGDFDLKVKITDNGKIQLKAFNRSNNNLIYETAPYTQGIGLTFKEEYNNIKELVDKLLLFLKNKN